MTRHLNTGPQACSTTLGSNCVTREFLKGRSQVRVAYRSEDRGLHPIEIQQENQDTARQAILPKAPQDREHVRQAEGLAPHPNSLRPMRTHLHVSHTYRSHRHLLDMINEPRYSRTDVAVCKLV